MIWFGSDYASTAYGGTVRIIYLWKCRAQTGIYQISTCFCHILIIWTGAFLFLRIFLLLKIYTLQINIFSLIFLQDENFSYV